MQRLNSERCHTIMIKCSHNRRCGQTVAVVIWGSMSFIHGRKQRQTTRAASRVGEKGLMADSKKKIGGRGVMEPARRYAGSGGKS